MLLFLTPFFLLFGQDSQVGEATYPAGSIAGRIPAPAGFERLEAGRDSFASWLRRLPLKPDNPPVRLFNGQLKNRQDVHAAVVDMEIGDKDLQQCADAVIRLRSEYLWARGEYDKIHFRFVSGFHAEYLRWREGFRPVVAGSRVTEAKTSSPCATYACFRQYLDRVFQYANTWSLKREMKAVGNTRDMQIGDVFLQGGFPGHAVIVADMAQDRSGQKIFLLLQSYMPAQEIHVLKNPADGTPWYSLDFGNVLETPEWTFRKNDLRRFR